MKDEKTPIQKEIYSVGRFSKFALPILTAMHVLNSINSNGTFLENLVDPALLKNETIGFLVSYIGLRIGYTLYNRKNTYL